MEDTIHTRYRELACASIVQGVNDWLENKYSDDYDLYMWIENCSWFDYLGLDREYFFVKVLELKEKGIRKVRFGDYGKKDNIQSF